MFINLGRESSSTSCLALERVLRPKEIWVPYLVNADNVRGDQGVANGEGVGVLVLLVVLVADEGSAVVLVRPARRVPSQSVPVGRRVAREVAVVVVQLRGVAAVRTLGQGAEAAEGRAARVVVVTDARSAVALLVEGAFGK